MAEKEHKSKVKENSTRIIDLGGHNYAVQHSFKNGKKTTYDITTKDNIKEINLENNKKENNKNKKESYTEVWNDLMERGGAYGDNSNPPDSGSKYITAPSQYESIKATSSGFVKSYYHNYFTTSSNGFNYADDCGSIASTNLFYYWYNRNTTKYKDLYMGSWLNTYKKIYSKVGSSAFIATLCGTLNYYMNINKNLFYTYWCTGTKSGKLIASEIDNGNPPILLMNGHYMYGNHYVLALGYYQFSYSSYDSTYILIADGWTGYPTRYVWGGCSGNWYFISVTPR